MIHKTLICLGLGLALPLAAHAGVTQPDVRQIGIKTDPQAALSALAHSVSSAEQAISDSRAHAAINALAASLAEAEMSIVLVDASETIYAASDEQILVELDYLLDKQPGTEANELIMAVVSERPLLAAAVQDIAVQSGMDEAMVAASIMSGLGDAPATASGQ